MTVRGRPLPPARSMKWPGQMDFDARAVPWGRRVRGDVALSLVGANLDACAHGTRWRGRSGNRPTLRSIPHAVMGEPERPSRAGVRQSGPTGPPGVSRELRALLQHVEQGPQLQAGDHFLLAARTRHGCAPVRPTEGDLHLGVSGLERQPPGNLIGRVPGCNIQHPRNYTPLHAALYSFRP